MTTARRATTADRAAAIGTTVRAFEHDPLVCWFFGDRYPECAPTFFGTLFDMRIDDGEVWATDDVVSIAEWNPPGGLRGDDAVRTGAWVRAGSEVFGRDVIERFRSWDQMSRPLTPPQPYWYLGILATHPDWQRRGLARAVLRPVGARADEEGMSMHLETATVEDVAFYTRLGFTVSHELELPDGPKVWMMGREPGVAGPW
jgi:GNAT superfamily N-acetyltransferase